MPISLHAARYTVTIRQGAEALEGLQPLWDQLVSQRAATPYYLRWDAFAAYFRHLRETGDGPLIIELRRDADCVGLLTLEVEQLRVFGIPLRCLRLASHDDHTPYADLLLLDGESLAPFWPALIAALKNRRIHWELIRFPGLRTDQQHKIPSRVHGMPAVVRHSRQAMYFDCSRGYEDLLQRLKAPIRKKLDRALRRLERDHRYLIRTVRSDDADADHAFSDFLRLEAAGWKGQEGTALAMSPRLTEFYRSLFRAQAAGSWGEIHLLIVDGDVVAAELCVVSDGIRVTKKTAYDERYGRFSPGHLMLAQLLKISCEDPTVRALDTEGAPGYLTEWNPNVWPVHEVWLCRHWSLTLVMRWGIPAVRLVRRAWSRVSGRFALPLLPLSWPMLVGECWLFIAGECWLANLWGFPIPLA